MEFELQRLQNWNLKLQKIYFLKFLICVIISCTIHGFIALAENFMVAH